MRFVGERESAEEGGLEKRKTFSLDLIVFVPGSSTRQRRAECVCAGLLGGVVGVLLSCRVSCREVFIFVKGSSGLEEWEGARRNGTGGEEFTPPHRGDTPVADDRMGLTENYTEDAGRLLRSGSSYSLQEKFAGEAQALKASQDGEELLMVPSVKDVFVAIESRDLIALRALIDGGHVPLDAFESEWVEGPLHMAAASGEAEAVAMLLDGGADPYARDARGRTALFHAAAAGSVTTAEVLILAGLKATDHDSRKVTPLHVACAGGFRDVACFLVSCGARVDAPDERGRSPLIYASASAVKVT